MYDMEGSQLHRHHVASAVEAHVASTMHVVEEVSQSLLEHHAQHEAERQVRLHVWYLSEC